MNFTTICDVLLESALPLNFCLKIENFTAILRSILCGEGFRSSRNCEIVIIDNEKGPMSFEKHKKERQAGILPERHHKLFRIVSF